MWTRALRQVLFLIAVSQSLVAQTASSVSLFSSPNPAAYGAAVTITATVTPSAATGSVTFYDGDDVLGVSPVSGGMALIRTRPLASGPRLLHVHYSGDYIFAPADSAVLKPGFRPRTSNSGSGTSFLISTIAGAGMPATAMPATAMVLPAPGAVATDAAGNVYFTDQQLNAVFRMDLSGTATRMAGTGSPGLSGDNGPAVAAQLSPPAGLAMDALGNLYIADTQNKRVRMVSPSGTITTVAGGGCCSSGDGGPATAAELVAPQGLAVDGSGNLYISDLYWVRMVSPAGVISTVAGNGSSGYTGDGEPATGAGLDDPLGIAVDASGNLFIADTFHNVVRKVAPNGIITTVAGTGTAGFYGDGQPATAAELNQPEAVSVDASSNLYIEDFANCRVRLVQPNGTISTFAGNGGCQFSGDGGPATSASLGGEGLALDPSGNLYIAALTNNRIRKVSSGIITTVAGGGSSDGAAAPFSTLLAASGIARDASGNIYVADTVNNRVHAISPAGAISTVAGNGLAGYSGDYFEGISAELDYPTALAVDSQGALYIADYLNEAIRRVWVGIITTVAGDGDTCPGRILGVCEPSGLAIDSAGDIYFADSYHSQVFEVSPGGALSLVAGNGTSGYSGDNLPATAAQLNSPHGLALDTQGNLYIADSENNCLRKVTNGVITTVGTGSPCYAGENPSATTAQLNYPYGVALDPAGNLYVTDNNNSVVRQISPGGTISTIAGYQYPGVADGNPAVGAYILSPEGVTTDTVGNIYFNDNNASLVYVLTPEAGPPVLTIGSTHSGSFSLNATGEYSLTVSNAALAGPTSGIVTVTEFAPGGLTITGMSGSGWTCGANTCTRSDSLSPGGTYSVIAVNVNVLSTAPSQVTNQATVGGGGAAGVLGAQDLTVLIAPATTIATDPSGLLFSADGLNPETAPQVELLPPGPHLIGVPSPQAGPPGVQYAFTGWSDSGPQTHSIEVTGTASTYTASFKTQYQVTASALPSSSAGAVSPATGSFFDSGSSVTLTAVGAAPYTFSYWSGAASGNSNPTSIAMSAPRSVTAIFVNCAITGDGIPGVADVQLIVNEALGNALPNNDLNNDGIVNVADVQKLIDAVMGLY
jgi:sugar lactone lactonase YvrE